MRGPGRGGGGAEPMTPQGGPGAERVGGGASASAGGGAPPGSASQTARLGVSSVYAPPTVRPQGSRRFTYWK